MPHRRSPVVHRAAPALLATVVVAFTLSVLVGPAAAQTTLPTVATTTTTRPVTPTTATPVTTAAGTATTTAPSTATTLPTTATTAAPTGNDGGSDDGGIPWIPILVGLAVLAFLVVAIALLARRRGAHRQAAADWRRGAADVTAEAGATARLLSTGTPASGQIAQQLVASLRAFEGLVDTAPDDAIAARIERARRALQMLGLAIDSDYRLRRQQPPPSPERVTDSQDSVRNAAAEADRALRAVYRDLTTNDH